MTNNSIQEFGLAYYIEDQIRKCRKKIPCKMSAFFSKQRLSIEQKNAALNLIQEANDSNLRISKAEIESLGLEPELKKYLCSSEYEAYNREHFSLLLELIASIIQNGVQVAYRKSENQILH